MQKINAFGGVIVTVTEEFTGKSGKRWIRATTKEGHHIVAPSHLFTKMENSTAKVNFDDFAPELTSGIEQLKRNWARA